MNTALRTTLTLALGISASSSAILAQTSASPPRLAAVSSTTVPDAVASEESYDPVAVSALLDRARELVQRGRIPAASQEYIRVVEMQRAQNVLPTEAMWELAELHNTYERIPERTANVLAALAADAERLGDPATEAKALLEATILYNKAYLPQKARDCASRLDALMTSPLVSEEFRREAQQRVIRK